MTHVIGKKVQLPCWDEHMFQKIATFGLVNFFFNFFYSRHMEYLGGKTSTFPFKKGLHVGQTVRIKLFLKN